MRVLLALALLVFGITAARPADLPGERGIGQYSYRAVTGNRAAQSVIYQYEAGVLVRAYWQAPWRHRHYFPTTGERPGLPARPILDPPSKDACPPGSLARNCVPRSHPTRELPHSPGRLDQCGHYWHTVWLTTRLRFTSSSIGRPGGHYRHRKVPPEGIHREGRNSPRVRSHPGDLLVRQLVHHPQHGQVRPVAR